MSEIYSNYLETSTIEKVIIVFMFVIMIFAIVVIIEPLIH